MLQDGRPRSALELACVERQRNDLLTGHERGLVWLEDHVKQTLGLCSLIKHWKGDKAGQRFEPQPWQIELLFAPLYGWWIEKDGVLRRRFTTGYCEVPRKNGKTFTTAVIGMRGLVGDSEAGPEVYAAAAARDQAGRLFDDMRRAVVQSRTLSNRIETRAHALIGKTNNGVAKAVSAQANTLHGLNPSVALLDELHAHPNDKVYEAMRTGQGARANPLLFMITTAGSDRHSVCWEQHELSRNVLEGHHQLDSHFAYIATAEGGDDLEDPQTWWKANPNLHVSVHEEFLRNEAGLAAKMPSKENSFRRLHLNQWVEQETRWLPMSAWDACDETITEEELEGRRCYAGLDLASTRDVNSLVLLFPLDNGRYALLPWFWSPEDAMNDRAERDRRNVCYWMTRGLIRGTHGNVTDFDGQIPEDIMAICKRYDVQELAYDPWGSAQAVVQRLQAMGFPLDKLVEFRQTLQQFAGPTKEFERLVYDRKLIHNKHEVMRWMASNVAVVPDANGNIRPHKEKSADKIDGIVAAIMALGVCMWREHAGPSVYENRGILVL